MILQSALFLLAAAALQGPTPEPTKTSVLPPDCGVTEAQVLQIVIPHYEERVAKSKAHEHDDALNDFEFSASVVDGVTSDFGLHGDSFLVAAVALTTGYCNGCHESRFAVIGLRDKTVAWLHEPDDGMVFTHGTDETLRAITFLRVFPDDKSTTLVLRYRTPANGMSGSGSIRQEWYRPRRTDKGDLAFDSIWAGDIEFGSSGRRGGSWNEGCAEMRSLWPRRAYKNIVHNLAGRIDPRPSARDPFRAIERPCSSVSENFGAVDFVSTTELTQGQAGPALLAVSPPTWARRDLRPTITFPFNLPMRRLFFGVTHFASNGRSELVRSVPSPDGKLVVELTERQGLDTLQIRQLSDSTVLRQIPDPAWIDDNKRFNEYTGYTFPWVGWTRNGERCLAVIELGYWDLPRVLVSLTPDGKGDRWEGFLPEGYSLPDGFILDLPEPGAKPRSTPSAH